MCVCCVAVEKRQNDGDGEHNINTLFLLKFQKDVSLDNT